MKLGHCHVENFGSYRVLNFDFSSTGLALLYGPTGAGKSTLPDIACWALFGITAKNGNADEVRSWLSDEPTSVSLGVEDICVTRIRGNSKQNDLYWMETSGAIVRGKDMAETQKLLEKRLGVTADLYLMAAYFSEFSPTASFFMAKAKERRELLEQIAPLELPVRLAERASEERKASKKVESAAAEALSKAQGRLEQAETGLARSVQDARRWDTTQAKTIADLTAKHENFEDHKRAKVAEYERQAAQWQRTQNTRVDAVLAKLEAMESEIKDTGTLTHEINRAERQIRKFSKVECPTCSAPMANPELNQAKADLEKRKADLQANNLLSIRFEAARNSLIQTQTTVNPILSQLEQAKTSVNHYAEEIEREIQKYNPFTAQVKRLSDEIADRKEVVDGYISALQAAKHEVASFTTLYDLSFVLRGELLKKAVSEIETHTNEIIEQHFDSEIRVSLELEGSDSLKVELFKGGYTCVYRQLSKGQRQLLKLAFGISVMRAASNKAGVHFDNLFFDESLDGLDSSFKIKTFMLFEKLAQTHDNIVLIDHHEGLQDCFATRYRVEIQGDESSIQVENG